MKTIAISGYFDPLHVGHLEYIELAADLGDHLTVIVNNDYQCKLKKGKSFMPEDDRVRIIQALAVVDTTFLSICLLYTSPSPRDRTRSRMPSSA